MLFVVFTNICSNVVCVSTTAGYFSYNIQKSNLVLQSEPQSKRFCSSLTSYALQSLKKHPYLFCGLFSCFVAGGMLYLFKYSIPAFFNKKNPINSCKKLQKNIIPNVVAPPDNIKPQNENMNTKTAAAIITGTLFSPGNDILPIQNKNEIFSELAQGLTQITTPPQENKKLEQKASHLKPSEVIKILQEIGAVESYDKELNAYKIKSAPQGYNQCWIYAGRNYIFMNHLFLAKNKEEVESLYKTMTNEQYATDFANGLIEIASDKIAFGYSTVTGMGSSASFMQLQKFYPHAFNGTLLPQTPQFPPPKNENFRYLTFAKLINPNIYFSGGIEALKNYINEIEKTNVAAKSHLVHDVMLTHMNGDLLDSFEKLIDDENFTIIAIYFYKERPYCHGIALVLTKEKNTQNNNLYHYLFSDSLNGKLPKKQIKRFNELLTNSTYRQETKLRNIVLLKSRIDDVFGAYKKLSQTLKQISENNPEKLDSNSVSEATKIIKIINEVCDKIIDNINDLNKCYISLTTLNNIHQFNGLALYQDKYKPYLNKSFTEQKAVLSEILNNTLLPALKKIESFTKNIQDKTFSQEEINLLIKDLEDRRNTALNELKKAEEIYQQQLEQWKKNDPGAEPSVIYLKKKWQDEEPPKPFVRPLIENLRKRIELIKKDPKNTLFPQKTLDSLKETIISSEKRLQEVTKLVDSLPSSIS